MSIITLVPKPAVKLPSKSESLEALDNLRQRIDKGEVRAFAAVGIEEGDVTCCWIGSSEPVTRLRMQGAILSLLHNWMDGEI